MLVATSRSPGKSKLDSVSGLEEKVFFNGVQTLLYNS